MTLPRRRLLAVLPTVLAGCGGLPGGDPDPATGAGPTGTPSEAPATTPAGDPVTPQSVSVGNARAESEFVTVAVEFAGETVAVASRELVPGERRTIPGVVDRAGTYDVVVETAAGERATDRWRVVAGLDGLAVTLADGITLRRTARCGADCSLRTAGAPPGDPLVGDGRGRWYAPAQVILDNPAGGATDAALRVSLDDRTLVDARYRLPPETRAVLPLTYRSGTYRVAVETAAGRVAGDWRVPQEPARVVDIASLDAGCGAANSRLRVENDDDRRHDLSVTVERDGAVRFAERYALAPGDRREAVPVEASGRYLVRLRVDGGPERTATWWSCPPHGPASVVVDATGTAELYQAGL
jgi:hypothetical protein